MKNHVILVLLVGFSVVTLSFCKKTALTVVPAIEFGSASKTSVNAGQDSLILTIRYSDGDGDLGENNADAVNCFVQDSRSPALLYKFRIKQLAPTGPKIAIKGDLELLIPPTGLVDGSKNEETAIFYIKIIDRAGNESNQVESPAILVKR